MKTVECYATCKTTTKKQDKNIKVQQHVKEQLPWKPYFWSWRVFFSRNMLRTTIGLLLLCPLPLANYHHPVSATAKRITPLLSHKTIPNMWPELWHGLIANAKTGKDLQLLLKCFFFFFPTVMMHATFRIKLASSQIEKWLTPAGKVV